MNNIHKICLSLIEEFEGQQRHRQQQIDELTREIRDIQTTRIDPLREIIKESELIANGPKVQQSETQFITDEQYKELIEVLFEHPDIVKDMRVHYNIESLRFIPASKYKEAYKQAHKSIGKYNAAK